MDVKRIEPIGFCSGVKRALNIVLNATINEEVKKPIYLLGQLIHNEKTVNALKSKGVIILQNASYQELINSVEKGTIISTAHGIPKDLLELIKSKNVDHIDTTCPFIKQIEELILEKIALGYTVLFYGIKHHPEANFITSLSDNVILITEKTENLELNIKNTSKLILTNQTTVSYLNVLMYYQKMKKIYHNLELADEVCNSSRIRQATLPEALNGIDISLIIGDSSSNNTKTLMNLSKQFVSKSYLIKDVSDLKNLNIEPHYKISIASGTSVSTSIVNEIYNHLKEDKKVYVSNLTDDDYLK